MACWGENEYNCLQSEWQERLLWNQCGWQGRSGQRDEEVRAQLPVDIWLTANNEWCHGSPKPQDHLTATAEIESNQGCSSPNKRRGWSWCKSKSTGQRANSRHGKEHWLWSNQKWSTTDRWNTTKLHAVAMIPHLRKVSDNFSWSVAIRNNLPIFVHMWIFTNISTLRSSTFLH